MNHKKLVKYLLLLTATGFFCVFIGLAVFVFKPEYEITKIKPLIYKDPESAVMSNLSKSEEELVSPPEFNRGSGFYNGEFDLELSAGEDCKIYYTTDSSVPTEKSNLYDGSIHIKDISLNENVSTKLAGITESEPVDKASIIRAVAYDPEGNRSEIVTKTYFVGYGSKDYNAQLPTVSLVSDPVNLFDDTVGIYTNYEMIEWEREADFSYYDDNGGFVFEQSIGVRLRGSSTRSTPLKDFTLFARSQYSGLDHFSYSMFTTPVDSLILRHRENAQNEGFLSYLVSDRDLTIQEYQLVNLYINGEFWGVYSLLSRIDKYYISNKLGIDIDNIGYLKINYFPDGSDLALQYYNEMLDFVTNADMSIEENYLKACSLIDIQSMIDCYVSNIYWNDFDSNCYKINSLAWRSLEIRNEGFEDGKWRFGLYDLDHAASTENFDIIDSIQSKNIEFAYQFNYFVEEFPFGAKGPIEDPILHSFMASPEFRQRFYDTFMEMSKKNFDPDRVLALLEKLPYQEGNERFAEFFINRPAYIFDYLDDYMVHYDEYYRVKQAENMALETRYSIAIPFDSVAATAVLLVFPVFMVLLVILYVKRNGSVLRERQGDR